MPRQQTTSTIAALRALALLCLSVVLASSAIGQEGDEPSSPMVEKIVEALLADPGERSQWTAEGAVIAAQDILSLQEELGIRFSVEQFEDIVAGINGTHFLKGLDPGDHPLLLHRDRLENKDRIQRYLAVGEPDAEAREAGLKALDELLVWAEAELLRDHPETKLYLEPALAQVRAHITERAANPLRVDYATKSEAEDIAKCKASFASLVERSLKRMAEEDTHRDRVRGIYILLKQTTHQLEYVPHGDRPHREDLDEANRKLEENFEQVIEWQDRKRKREQEQWRRELELRDRQGE